MVSIEDIAPSALASCNMGVRVTQKKIFWVIYNDDNARYLGFQAIDLSNPLDLTNFFEKNLTSLKSLKNLFIEMCSFRYTLIPKSLYDETQKEALFHFNYGISDSRLLSRLDQKKQLFSIFPVTVEMQELSVELPKALLTHCSLSAINYLLKKPTPTPNVFVQLFDNFINIVVVQEEDVLFSNSFTYYSPEESLYYILSVYEKLNLSHISTPLTIDNSLGDPNTIPMTEPYIRYVAEKALPNNLSYHLPDSDISNMFSGTFSLLTCV